MASSAARDGATERVISSDTDLMQLIDENQNSRYDPMTNRKLGPEAVALKLVHALESRNPKRRYYVTLPTYAAALLRRVLPTRALDAILARN